METYLSCIFPYFLLPGNRGKSDSCRVLMLMVTTSWPGCESVIERCLGS